MAIVVAFFEIFITSASLSHGWFGSDRKAALWWVHYIEKQADTVSCFGSGCCSLQGTSGTKANMVGVQLHKPAAYHLGGLIVPGNAQRLAVGGTGIHQQIHDLVEGIFIHPG